MIALHIPRRPLRAMLGLATILMAAPAAQAVMIPGGSDLLNGHPVAAYVEQDAGHLVAIGFEVSGAAVRDPGTNDTALFLALPPQVAGTPFTQLELDWDPNGHPPPGIYTVPHFDFHFYTIPESVRQNIVGSPTTPDPGPQFRPLGYDPPAATVPGMGGHSYDKTGPEFIAGAPVVNGGTFTTKTLLYGYYNLQMAFLEPVSTQSYLEEVAAMATPQVEADIRQPSQYALASLPTLVPTRYEIAYDPTGDQYFISVQQFITAVPEPGSLALWGMGSIALVAAWRRRVSVK